MVQYSTRRKSTSSQRRKCHNGTLESPTFLTGGATRFAQLLHTLGSAFPQVRTTAAQAIAGFGAADLAMNDWADLLDNLLACVTGPTVPEPMKVAALQVSFSSIVCVRVC